MELSSLVNFNIEEIKNCFLILLQTHSDQERKKSDNLIRSFEANNKFFLYLFEIFEDDKV